MNQAVGDGRFAAELLGEVSGCDMAVALGDVTGLSCVVTWKYKTH